MLRHSTAKKAALFLSLLLFLFSGTPAFASESPFLGGLSLLNNHSSGARLLASIQLSSTAGLFLKGEPKSSPLPDLVMSPIEATKSSVIDQKTQKNSEYQNVSKPETQISDLSEFSDQPESPSHSDSIRTSTSSTPTIQPTPQPISVGGLSADILFNMVNAHRASLNLPAFQKDDRACTIAQLRAPQVLGELYGGVMHQGLKNMNLPYWNTENIISMRTNEEAFNWWIHDEIHKEAIEGSYKYSCVACSGNSCAEEFTDFTPK